MKKIILFTVSLLILFITLEQTNDLQKVFGAACKIGPEFCLAEDDGGGDPIVDTVSPVIHIDTNNITIRAAIDNLSLPDCYVTDNINFYLHCSFTYSYVNNLTLGHYNLFVDAVDSSGNQAETVIINIDVIPSGKYYNDLTMDDYIFTDEIINISSDTAKVATSEVVYVDENCLSFGDSYEFIGLKNNGRFLFTESVHLGDLLYDHYLDSNNEIWYDYGYTLFDGFHYDVYEVYDKCQAFTYFDQNIDISGFEGMVIWDYNVTASNDEPIQSFIDDYGNSTAYADYTMREIYISYEMIAYASYFISIYGY